MTVKQAAMALTGQPAEIGEESKISVKLILACLALFLSGFGLFLTVVSFYHSSAVNTIKENQKESIAALRGERDRVLENYPTWRDINRMRDEDRKYLDSQFGAIRDEIRRSR